MANDAFVPPPMSPGEFLREEILPGTGFTQETLAEAMSVSRFTVNQIINEKRGVTAEMALRLERVLSISAGHWLKLQQDVDLYHARRKIGRDLSGLTVLRTAPDKPATRSISELVAQDLSDGG